MRQTMKKFLPVFLALSLFFAMVPVSALAEGEQPLKETIHIASVEDLEGLAENCRLDSWSQGRIVVLDEDLDLRDSDFTAIPTFGGTFEGQDHTIQNFKLEQDGSVQGFFRYVQQGAVVRNLNVSGQTVPGGSRTDVGGLAGSNGGCLENCTFRGIVSGASRVGGIAGTNTVTGVISGCTVGGNVYGNHFVGGLAGQNNGVISGCTNNGSVNTTVSQNEVNLGDLKLEDLLDTEKANDITDIGGVAGASAGVIRGCVNRGAIGYAHIGYNVGGIAGSQTGYVEGCVNYGAINGRKEAGGIVGQMEPTALVEYEEDALQILQKQLSAMGSTVSRTAANVQSTGDAIYGQVGTLYGQVQDASDAVGLLLPDPQNPSLPDADTVTAARNGISSSLSGMGQTLQGMNETTQSAVGTLSNNLHTLQSQVSAMSATLGNVSQTMGGSIEDVSDKDTPEDLSGKVEKCVNHGTVLGDLNVGGITGAMALENDLDPEDDWQIQGNNSLNFESQLRAVILSCENNGEVTVGKCCGGGIVGLQSLGLVKKSQNTGSLSCEDANYVGGISGQSMGFIRESSAKCTLSGKANVGGIAGSAAVVTDCRCMVALNGVEKLGAVLGGTEDNTHDDVEIPISGNYYLPVERDLGGIDGISYDTMSQPLKERAFFALEELPELYTQFLEKTKRQPGYVARLVQIAGRHKRLWQIAEFAAGSLFFEGDFSRPLTPAPPFRRGGGTKVTFVCEG